MDWRGVIFEHSCENYVFRVSLNQLEDHRKHRWDERNVAWKDRWRDRSCNYYFHRMMRQVLGFQERIKTRRLDGGYVRRVYARTRVMRDGRVRKRIVGRRNLRTKLGSIVGSGLLRSKLMTCSCMLHGVQTH